MRKKGSVRMCQASIRSGNVSSTECLRTTVKERFAERDIRAKVGSDAETVEKAAHILGSASPRIVRKHYRRKPDVIR
jgi:hypothetical protein